VTLYPPTGPSGWQCWLAVTDEPPHEATSEADRALWGYPSPGESRWPATAAVTLALVLQAALPKRLTVGPSWVIPVLELCLVVPLIIANPSRLTATSRDMRKLSISLIALINAANITSLALLVDALVNGSKVNGKQLILAAVGIWFTQVIVFGMWYWEIDRGGPVARTTVGHAAPDLLFPQMENPKVSRHHWYPTLIDYMYVSLTNSTAFSPTDTMPLSVRSKLLMAAQSVVSLTTIAVVGARAVNILQGG
jgi:uncharacterized membrane protein